MVRLATVVGLLLVLTVCIIGGAALSMTVLRPVPFRTPDLAAATVAATAQSLKELDSVEVENSQSDDVVDDSVLFLPGFGAPLEKQVRHVDTAFTLEKGGNTTLGALLSVLWPLWPVSLICIFVVAVLRLIDGPWLDYYVWYVNSMLAWSE